MRPGAKIVVVVLAVIGIALLLWSTVPWFTESKTEASVAPDFASRVSVGNARIVMPTKGGEPAALYFDVTNRGTQNVVLRAVTVEHAKNAAITYASRPVDEASTQLDVHPGQTLSLGPQAVYVAVSGYDSNVVPGAKLNVQLGFGTSAHLDTTATVESAVGPNGAVNEDSVPD